MALGALLALGGFVVWTSLSVGTVRCEVCIDFEGRTACRAVDARTEDEARAAARTNACAQLTSGVTSTLACERTTPLSSRCSGRGE